MNLKHTDLIPRFGDIGLLIRSFGSFTGSGKVAAVPGIVL